MDLRLVASKTNREGTGNGTPETAPRLPSRIAYTSNKPGRDYSPILEVKRPQVNRFIPMCGAFRLSKAPIRVGRRGSLVLNPKLYNGCRRNSFSSTSRNTKT